MQRCRHCYQETYDDGPEVCLEGAKRLADAVFGSLDGHRVSINLTGGEPLLLDWLPDLVAHLHTFDQLEELSILSNGLHAERVLDRLSGFERLAWLKLSVESGLHATNDAVRGKGHLAQVERNLDRMRAAGRRGLVAMITLGRYNLDSIETSAAFACDHGFSGVIFERFVPLGRGRAMAGQALGPRDWAIAVQRIAALAGIEADPASDAWLPYKAFWLHMQEGPLRIEGARCNLGRESMALMPDGAVLPCRRLPMPAGRLPAEPFDQVRDRLADWAPERIAGRLRGDLCGLCGLPDCAGCRAMALAVGGDALGDDPACPLLIEP